MKVENLYEDNIPEVVDVLFEAFYNYPVMQYVLGKKADYDNRLSKLAHFYNADPAYGKGVADKLGIDVKKVEKYAKMNLKELFEATSEEGFKK